MSIEGYLRKSRKKIEEARQQIESNEGITKDSVELRMLEELIKEQLPNEDIGHSTRQTR